MARRLGTKLETRREPMELRLPGSTAADDSAKSLVCVSLSREFRTSTFQVPLVLLYKYPVVIAKNWEHFQSLVRRIRIHCGTAM